MSKPLNSKHSSREKGTERWNTRVKKLTQMEDFKVTHYHTTTLKLLKNCGKKQTTNNT